MVGQVLLEYIKEDANKVEEADDSNSLDKEEEPIQKPAPPGETRKDEIN
jgi:hypothetical protein